MPRGSMWPRDTYPGCFRLVRPRSAPQKEPCTSRLGADSCAAMHIPAREKEQAEEATARSPIPTLRPPHFCFGRQLQHSAGSDKAVPATGSRRTNGSFSPRHSAWL